MQWSRFFHKPQNVGPLPAPDTSGRAGGGCGDLIEIQLAFDGPVVADAAFLAKGCPGAIAGAAATASLLVGKTIYEAASLGIADIKTELGDIPPERESCLYLSEAALATALEHYIGDASVKLPVTGMTAVAMSGGVDSSLTALRLLESGERLLGVTQRLHDFGRSGRRSCCTAADLEDARAVAALGGFPHFVLDMRDEFTDKVIRPFCDAYVAGQTPNPCVDCNRRLRWKRLLEGVGRLGATSLATGHYARISDPDAGGRCVVKKALDPAKDQSYMFWAAPTAVLSRLLTPLGELTKEEVREAAAELCLPVAEKADSQDVCFVPDGDYAGFVSRETGHVSRPGPIVNADGARLGEHRGLIHYTIGQRRGLGVSAPKPLYVTGLDCRHNTVVVGERADLGVSRLTVYELNLIGEDSQESSFRAEVMLRYNGPSAAATIHRQENDWATIEFDRPFGPAAPGQSAVFYDGELLLGGGIIKGTAT